MACTSQLLKWGRDESQSMLRVLLFQSLNVAHRVYNLFIGGSLSEQIAHIGHYNSKAAAEDGVNSQADNDMDSQRWLSYINSLSLNPPWLSPETPGLDPLQPP